MFRLPAAPGGAAAVLAAGSALAACGSGQSHSAPPAPPPGSAANAVVRTELRCYLPGETVRIAGSGYRPGARYSVILDGAALGRGTAGAHGSIAGKLLGHAGPVTVYVHYLNPRGHLLATADVGRAGGICGDMRRARERKLFPFHRVRAGTWTLQFDTSRVYSPASTPRIARRVAVGA